MKVRIVGKHPHTGETGTITGQVIRVLGTGPKMYEVKLDACDMWIEACFAKAENLQEIEEPSSSGVV